MACMLYNKDELQHKAKTVHYPKWDDEVSQLINSDKWLKKHGLKRNRLKMDQILSQIGFKHAQGFVGLLEKPVGSTYAGNIFQQFKSSNGRSYNITVSRRNLHQIKQNLINQEKVLRNRIKWLTSGSRQMFGIIEERSVSIVLHTSSVDKNDLDVFFQSICILIDDQISKLARFNLVRSQEISRPLKEHTVPVTEETKLEAIDWLKNQRFETSSKTSCVEATILALKDSTADAVYLAVEGDIIDTYRELFLHKTKEISRPLHIVSFNATQTSTINFLKQVAITKKGRFHAFSSRHAYGDMNLINDVVLTSPGQLFQGGVPDGAGVREEVHDIWKEWEECTKNLAEVESIISEVPLLRHEHCKIDLPDPESRQEHLLSSKDWLKRHGLKAQGLTAYQQLASCSFKHVDAVVDIKTKPVNKNVTDAESVKKLINAKYCDKFVHAQWKDGTIVHVYITQEQQTKYANSMRIALDKIRRRIHWLKQGSKEVFGTILEENVYILIDASKSMKDKLPVLKQKLFQLLQEQIQLKKKFNVVAFNTKARAWKEKLADVTENSIIDAWHWIKNIEAEGSTNTLAALRISLQDIGTHAVYLLTDGRPDQPDHVIWNCMLERTQKILSETIFKKQIPIHTVAYSCNDVDAAKFLNQLSRDTGGRYHNFECHPDLYDVIESYESEDIALLKKELEWGEHDLEKVTQLRTRCITLDWYFNKKPHNLTPRSIKDDQSIVSLAPPKSSKLPMKTKSSNSKFSFPAKGITSSISIRPNTAGSAKSFESALNNTPNSHVIRNSAHHTRTSVLRMKSAHSRDLEGWILPETRQLLETQLRRSAEASYEIRRAKICQQLKYKAPNTKRRKNNNLNTPSSTWLKRNSLAARRLTLIDALAPTVIKFTPKYVPLLDTYVSSKVFDDVFPIAHLSPKGRASNSKLSLVNPNAVNLVKYRERVNKSIDEYETRLNAIVDKHLPEHEKQLFGERPISYLNNKNKILDLFEKFECSVKEKELQLLENEIELGKKYIQESKEVEKLSKESSMKNKKQKDFMKNKKKTKYLKQSFALKQDSFNSKQSVEKYQNTAPSVNSSENGSVKCSKNQDIPESSVVSKDKTSDPEENESTVSIKENLPSRPKTAKRNKQNYSQQCRGMRGIARNTEDGLYYDVTIKKKKGNHKFVVDFVESGMRCAVSNRHVIVNSGAVPCPPLKIGDHALCLDVSEVGLTCYKPSIVIGCPLQTQVRNKKYTLLKYDGYKIQVKRKGIIRISSPDYKFAVRYIKFANQVDDNVGPIDFIKSDESKSRLYELVETSNVETKSYFENLNEKFDKSSQQQVLHRNLLKKLYKRQMKGSRKVLELIIAELREEKRQLKEELEKQQREVESKFQLVTSKLESQEKSKVETKSAEVQTIISKSSMASHSSLSSADEKQENNLNEANRTSSNTSASSKSDENEKDLTHEKSQSLAKDSSLNETVTKSSDIKIGDEVICLDRIFGYYFRGTISGVENAENSVSYLVTSCKNHVTKSIRRDLITEDDDAVCQLDVNNYAIAPRKDLGDYFFPSKVTCIKKTNISLTYYDGEKTDLERHSIYMISEEKYNEICLLLQKCANQWVGETVVARNDKSGIFELGMCMKAKGMQSNEILWWDGTTSSQHKKFMFTSFSHRRNTFLAGDYVVAIFDGENLKYLPGKICDENESNCLVVEFCNGSRIKWMPEDNKFSYLISEDFYNELVSFYKLQKAIS